MTNVPSGWYPNPHNPGEEMYWDGTSWSGAARKLSAARVEEATMVRSDVDAVGAQVARPAAAEPALVEQTLEPASDEFDFRQAMWPAPVENSVEPVVLGAPVAPGAPVVSGVQAMPVSPQQPAAPSTSNWFALTALILGVCGAALTVVPFLVGLVGGGILDLAAIVFCVFGVLRGRQLDGTGIVWALIGGALGALGLVAMTVGAGTVW